MTSGSLFRRAAWLGLLPLFFIACGPGGGSSGSLPTPTPGTTPTPTPTPTPPGDGDTVIIGDTPGLCAAGDVARVDFDAAGTARFPLNISSVTCTPAKDNRNEEYTLILYNTTGSAISFRIDSPLAEAPPSLAAARLAVGDFDDAPPKPPQSTYKYSVGVNPTDLEAANLATTARLNGRNAWKGSASAATRFRAQAFSEGDEVELRVRCSRSDPNEICTTSAILRAQDTHINIWVDRDHPVDINGVDDCGTNADCLTSAQLDNIVTIFENNIYPLETTLLGDESDIDGDNRINVVITPFLNRDLKAAAYFDPRNLEDFDAVSNPVSNEGEFIFVFAPDSLGNYPTENGFTENVPFVDADTYVGRDLNAWIAFELAKIISYNQHVLVSGGSPEDDWINDGLGTVMADLAGFNIWREAAYSSLSAPQIDDVRQAEELDIEDVEGMEYLFFLYYLQSQMNGTVTDSNGDNFDDDLTVLGDLMTSGTTGIENLEAAATITFDSDVETEFQALFKDWTVAVVTSGTNRSDLQQGGQTAVKYYLGANPTVYGPAIADAGGSTRTGAVGLEVGIDLNNIYDEDGVPSEDDTLFENSDEHTWAPGNKLFGYVDPYAAMYVRLGGLFQSTQTVSILASSNQLQGFLVRRSDIDYPHVYAESIFGSIDQHAEDLDLSGPNPYWPVKLNLGEMLADAPANDYSPDFLTIVGTIDTPQKTRICGADITQCTDDTTSVPDTDKYMFTVPLEADGGELAFSVRRQFDDGSDEAALTPMLAIVSSKDVPYPYVPHPVRGDVVGGAPVRQQYRWVTPALNCGDGDSGSSTNVATVNCVSPTDDVVSRASFSGLAENTGTIPMSSGSWSGDILGFECDGTPDLLNPAPSGVNTGGYFGLFPVTQEEISPSSLGSYTWSSSFMTASYAAGAFPDVLFSREFMIPVTGYPSVEPETMYDPRSVNGLTMNCHQLLAASTDPDETPESPDDFLTPAEIRRPATLAEQILVEMSRGRFDPFLGDPEEDSFSDAKYDTDDVFALDGDSRDKDTLCSTVDFGNNMNTFTVRRGEGSLLIGGFNGLEPHIAGNLHSSAIPTADDLGQEIYRNPGAETLVNLVPGKSYTLIVAGKGATTGNYELRIRKINPNRIGYGWIVLVDRDNIKCYSEL